MEFILGSEHKCQSERCVNSDYDHARAWLRLIRDKRWSRRVKHQLLSKFKCPIKIYDAGYEISHLLKTEFKEASRADLLIVEQDIKWLTQSDAHLIVFGSQYFPSQLIEISDSPLALFALGNIDLMGDPQIAIVGSRRPSPIGAKVAQEIACDLSRFGLVVTSGMALGVDGVSHRGALERGGDTIAVLGNGLDVIYPTRHRVMYERIREKGLLLSEYSPGVQPTRYSFPERNRVVSGLALGVVIIEAALKSGTLITARLAMEQNKEVMVVPGAAVSKQYEGSHKLLRDGAALITNAQDVLNTLNYTLREFVKPVLAEEITPNANLHCEKLCDDSENGFILSLIGAEPVTVDEIISNSGLTPAEVSSMLLILELEGRIALDSNGGYINLG